MEVYTVERGVLCHVIGTLLAWGLGLIVYLMYRLWQDYISTILTAFIVSQTLHKQRAQLVRHIRQLRDPRMPSLLHRVLSLAAKPQQSLVAAVHSIPYLIRFAVYDVPALVQLALLQLVFLLGADLSTWYALTWYTCTTTLLSAGALYVLEKTMALWADLPSAARGDAAGSRLIADNDLAAIVVLAGLLLVVGFVTTTLAVQSVQNGAQLLVDGSSWMRDVRPETAEAVSQVVRQGVDLGVASLDELRQAEYQWTPVLAHLIDAVRGAWEAPNASSSAFLPHDVVTSTFDKLRECYPQATWLRQAEDLGKLVLWAASRATSGATSGATSATLGGGDASAGMEAPAGRSGIGGAGADAAGGGGDVPLAHPSLLEEAQHLFSELQDPAELLAMLREYVTSSASLMPTTIASSVLQWSSWSMALVLQLVSFVISFGGTAVVFLTMTFYMLSTETDVLTFLVDKIHPATSTSTLQRMRDTVDVVIIMPFAGAARAAIVTELTYVALSCTFGELPFRHLASLGVVVLTLFPLVYAWWVCLPWVLVCCFLLGRWATGLSLLALMVAVLGGDRLRPEAEIQLQRRAGVGDYVHAFSLVLGVYVFGLSGVLFGPMLVCVAKLLSDVTFEFISTAEGHVASPPGAAYNPRGSYNSSAHDGAFVDVDEQHAHAVGDDEMWIGAPGAKAQPPALRERPGKHERRHERRPSAGAAGAAGVGRGGAPSVLHGVGGGPAARGSGMHMPAAQGGTAGTPSLITAGTPSLLGAVAGFMMRRLSFSTPRVIDASCEQRRVIDASCEQRRVIDASAAHVTPNMTPASSRFARSAGGSLLPGRMGTEGRPFTADGRPFTGHFTESEPPSASGCRLSDGADEYPPDLVTVFVTVPATWDHDETRAAVGYEYLIEGAEAEAETVSTRGTAGRDSGIAPDAFAPQGASPAQMARVRVRVAAPCNAPWSTFLQRVEERLVIVGCLPPGRMVLALRSATDAALVASLEDLRDGEVLEALLRTEDEPSRAPRARLSDSRAATLTGGDGSVPGRLSSGLPRATPNTHAPPLPAERLEFFSPAERRMAAATAPNVD